MRLSSLLAGGPTASFVGMDLLGAGCFLVIKGGGVTIGDLLGGVGDLLGGGGSGGVA